MTAHSYRHAALGGTFDRLHNGHKSLLTKAFSIATAVTVGITTQDMTTSKPLARLIASYEDRKQAVEAFLTEQGVIDRVKIVPLSDPYGPAGTDVDIDAIVVSAKTLTGAEAVNAERQKHQVSPLAVAVAEYVEAEDRGDLSSSRIRLGEVDRTGFSYKQFLTENAPFVPPAQIRAVLQQPLGDLIEGHETRLTEAVEKVLTTYSDVTTVAVVGDIVAKSFFDKAQNPQIVVIDHRSKRGPVEPIAVPEIYITMRTPNEAGRIEKKAIDVLTDIDINQHTLVVVDGEEDLLVLPIILLLPLQSVVLYGQPQQGIVAVTVTEDQKAKTVDLLKQCIIKEHEATHPTTQ